MGSSNGNRPPPDPTAAPRCPDCGETSQLVLYGLPGPEARLAERDHRFVLPGCLTPPDPEHWICSSGHRWRDDDEERWQSVLLATLAEYGYSEE